MDTRPLRCKKYNGLNTLTEFHFTVVKNIPKKEDGSDCVSLLEFQEFLKQQSIVEKAFFDIVKNSPPVLDNIKDSKTGLFIPFRNFELEMKPLEDGSPKAGVFVFRIGMIDRSYRAMNQARRYASLFQQRNTAIEEVMLELVGKPWTQLYSTTKIATTV